jgi:outer membrane protein assembly factor BamB
MSAVRVALPQLMTMASVAALVLTAMIHVAVALPLASLTGTCRAAEPDAAPAEAWPLARGCAAGTGVSAATLRLPLEERWRRSFDKTAFGAVPVIAGGVVYVGDLDGTFHALALADGATKWSFKVKDAGFASAAAASTDPALPLVVVGDDTGIVRAFDLTKGTVAWEYATDAEISGGPTLLPGAAGGRVLVGSQDASLSCLNLADGAVVWKHSIADQIRCSPTVARTAAGEWIFLAGCDGKLHVIDAATGAERSAVAIEGPTGTTPAASGDRVFFGTEGGGFFAIDFVKAEVAWRTQPAANGQAYRSSAAVSGGLAIVGSRSKAVEAFALADGARAWRWPCRGKVDGSPVVVQGDGGRQLAIVADAAGKLAALDAATGEPTWEFDAGGGFSAGPAVATESVVIASDDGTVWCFSSRPR